MSVFRRTRNSRGSLGADPSFQLGMALGDAYGSMWANNARQRQEKKLDDYIEQQRNADLMAEIEATKNPMQDRLQQEASNALNYQLSSPMLNAIDRPNNIDRAIDAVVGDYGLGGVNYIKKQADMTPLERAKQQYRNLGVDDVTAWAKKQGINQEVIDARIPALQKELATNVGGLMASEITKNLYSGNMDNIITGIQQLDELAKYDPATADRLRKTATAQQARVQGLQDRMMLADYKGQVNTGNSLPFGYKSLSAINDRIAQIEELGVPDIYASEYNLLKNWKVQNGLEPAPQVEKPKEQGQEQPKTEVKQAQPVQEVNQDEVDSNDFNLRSAINYARNKGIPTNIVTGLPEAQNTQQQAMLREIEALYGIKFR